MRIRARITVKQSGPSAESDAIFKIFIFYASWISLCVCVNFDSYCIKILFILMTGGLDCHQLHLKFWDLHPDPGKYYITI